LAERWNNATSSQASLLHYDSLLTQCGLYSSRFNIHRSVVVSIRAPPQRSPPHPPFFHSTQDLPITIRIRSLISHQIPCPGEITSNKKQKRARSTASSSNTTIIPSPIPLLPQPTMYPITTTPYQFLTRNFECHRLLLPFLTTEDLLRLSECTHPLVKYVIITCPESRLFPCHHHYHQLLPVHRGGH